MQRFGVKSILRSTDAGCHGHGFGWTWPARCTFRTENHGQFHPPPCVRRPSLFGERVVDCRWQRRQRWRCNGRLQSLTSLDARLGVRVAGGDAALRLPDLVEFLARFLFAERLPLLLFGRGDLTSSSATLRWICTPVRRRDSSSWSSTYLVRSCSSVGPGTLGRTSFLSAGDTPCVYYSCPDFFASCEDFFMPRRSLVGPGLRRRQRAGPGSWSGLER